MYYVYYTNVTDSVKNVKIFKYVIYYACKKNIVFKAILKLLLGVKTYFTHRNERRLSFMVSYIRKGKESSLDQIIFQLLNYLFKRLPCTQCAATQVINNHCCD